MTLSSDLTSASGTPPGLGWLSILRLGLVQASLGSIVVLMTSTLNRVMVVELGLAAVIPGILVGLHYGVQITRPRMGYGADAGGNCTRWVIGGMAILGAGAILAALSIALAETLVVAGLALALVAYFAIGLGVSASGTTLLALLSRTVAPARRPAAATITWVLMIAGIIVSALVAGALLEPFSLTRLVLISAGVSGVALLVTSLAVWGIERRSLPAEATAEPAASPAKGGFFTALAEIWAEPRARQFTIFVFTAMLAYSAQDLILEPFAGLIFGLTAGESTQLAGFQHMGVLAGMVLVGTVGGLRAVRRHISLLHWTLLGCLLSATALVLLIVGGLSPASWPLQPTVIFLGFGNGMFAVGAIGAMMTYASEGRSQREGTRIGLWGAAQAIAFGLGGVVGTLGVDLLRWAGADALTAYGGIFVLEAFLFLISAVLALQTARAAASARQHQALSEGDPAQVIGQSIIALES